MSFVICFLLACQVPADTDGFEFVANEVGAREVVDLNARLETVGWREVVDPGIGLRREPFFRNRASEQRVPLLEGYTNLEAQALSDTGLVVGYASRSLGHTEGSLEAFVWQPPDGKTKALGKAGIANGTVAMSISSNGRVVSGYWLAADPPRMAPCVWEMVDGQWQWTPLSTLNDYNPFLLAGRVMVSGDGNKVAACITVETIPGAVTRYVNHLFVWSRQAQGGTWERRQLVAKAVRLAGINNQGMVAGTCTVDRQKRACVVDPHGEIHVLGVLPGDSISEALDVNNLGVVVGLSDNPARVAAGPRAFVWSSQGDLRPLAFPREYPSSVATSINDEGHIAGYVAGEQKLGEPSRTLSFLTGSSRAR
jgi:uncharacterized membrane protein